MDKLEAKLILQIVLGEFRDKLAYVKDLVVRDATFPEAPNKIKVVMGMRRVGKTYFVYQQILRLLREGTDKNCILYINFEDDRLLPLDQEKLALLVDAFYSLFPENHEKRCYLFFDEIQNVHNWPLVIRRLSDSKNVDICLTGSSAKLLSREIATSLRGRSLAIEIWPYSFSEFMRAKKITIDTTLYDNKTQDRLKQAFHHYLTEGGFPELISYNAITRQQILQEYIDVAIYRDIVERHNVKHPTLIKNLLLTLLYNFSRTFTSNKFYNDVKSQGFQVGKDILYDYAHYIEDAYVAFLVSMHDSSIRKVRTNPKKTYAIDPGLVRAVTLEFNRDLGLLFENIVYIDLRRRSYHVSYYLTKERFEVDFLIKSPNGHQKLLQVAWNTADANTLDREKRALEAGMKELGLEGDLITLDSYLRKGIE